MTVFVYCSLITAGLLPDAAARLDGSLSICCWQTDFSFCTSASPANAADTPTSRRMRCVVNRRRAETGRTGRGLLALTRLSHFMSRMSTTAATSNTLRLVQWIYRHTHTHTHSRLTALCPGLPRWSNTRTDKRIWILLKQETVSGCGISLIYAVCTLFQTDNHASTPQLSFLQAGCPSCCSTNSIKSLKIQWG